MNFLSDGPEAAPLAVLLAHGAGTAMDAPFMAAFAQGIGSGGFRVARFEFPYMATRRTGGRKRPPNPEPALVDAYREAVQELGDPAGLVIGGKSLGGRIASLLAEDLGAAGLLCLGFPFHAPGKPPGERIVHLAGLTTPTLIIQGTRDPFGSPAEIASYELSPAIALHWLEDGDHDFKPRAASARTQAQNWAEGIAAAVEFLLALPGGGEQTSASL